MKTVALILVGLVSILHIYFMVLEMFLWDKPYGRKVFGLTKDFSAQSKALAANQGLYNGFLAAGLIWGLLSGLAGEPVIIFFLSCIIVAGFFGGITVSKKIIYVQAVPAAIALFFIVIS